MRQYYLLLYLIMITACGSNNPTAPHTNPVEPVISVSEGRFSFKAQGFGGITDTIPLEWLNYSPVVRVETSGRIGWGSGTLSISDGVGNNVFLFDLREKGAYLTEPGVPGSWTITLNLRNASGDIDIVVTSLD
jgi:hypothetical protein